MEYKSKIFQYGIRKQNISDVVRRTITEAVISARQNYTVFYIVERTQFKLIAAVSRQ